MNNFKVGDLVGISEGSENTELIIKKEGEFPQRITSIKGSFVRFNGNSSGWYACDFILSGSVGPKAPDGGLLGPSNCPKGVSCKYERRIVGLEGVPVTVDVYRVLDAFNVTDPAMQHLIKKALCAGLRGHKDLLTDLGDIKESIEKSIKLEIQKREIAK